MVMSGRKRRWIVGLMALVLAAGAVWFFRQAESPKAQVRRQLDRLCEAASKEEGESVTAGLLRIRTLTGLFAPSSKLEFRSEYFGGEFTPEQIASHAARLRALFRRMKIDVRDPVIEIIAPDEAMAEFTGTFEGEPRSGGTVRDLRELICHLKKSDGRWLITSITIREILER